MTKKVDIVTPMENPKYLTEQQRIDIAKPFPEAVMSTDDSRGFALTSVKAAYILERLNEVFGICGAGWRYAHSPLEWTEAGGGSNPEIVTEVALQYRIEGEGAPPVTWDNMTMEWVYLEGYERVWSWPIFSTGGKGLGKGSARLTDARKSAVTNGITKSASVLGVAADVFKGLVKLGGRSSSKSPPKQTRRQTKPKVYSEEQMFAFANAKTQKGTPLGDLTASQLGLIIGNTESAGRKEAATALFTHIAKSGPPDDATTFNSLIEEKIG